MVNQSIDSLRGQPSEMYSRSMLREFKTSRKYGQHFLVDISLQKKIVSYASLKSEDVVLEVGPGIGDLTSLILKKAGRVIAVEKDQRLVKLLRERFRKCGNIEIIEGDVLKQTLPSFNKIISNLPYYISSKFMLIIVKKSFELGVFTLQKEFVQRLIALKGTPEYGRLSVALQHKMNVIALDSVPSESFSPKPKIDSVIIKITPKQNFHKLSNENLFADLIRQLFTQRNRKISKVLFNYMKSKIGGTYENWIAILNPPDSRVFETSIEEFEILSENLNKILKEKARHPS